MAACTLCASASEPWDLDSCISYAISHSITVKTRALDRYSGELDITEAKDRFLPHVSGYGSQSFSFGRGLTSENTYANRNTSNFAWGANMSLPIFQGLSAVRRLDYAKANLRVLLEQEEAAKDDITLNVISQYLQVLYTREMHRIAVEQLHMSKVELDRRRELLDAGKIPELDIAEAESQVAQDELSEVTARNENVLALLDLAQLLELPDPEGFDVTALPDNGMPLMSADDVYNHALNSNHTVRASRLNVEVADRSIRLAKTGYLPTLSMSAGIGSSYYKVSGFDNDGFGSQMRHNLSKSLGFSLSIPIFDAFSTRNSVRKARVQKSMAELQLENTEKQLFKSIQQAYYQAVAAEKKKASSAMAQESTRIALEAMQEKYNYGKANATEYEQAKSAYVRAASQAVQAKYESILRLRILQFYNK